MKEEKILPRPDEAALQRLLTRYAGQAEELILRLAWQAGLNRPEMHALTWEQVDLEQGELHLPTHTVPLTADLSAALHQRYDAPLRRSSPYVILTARSHPTSVHISRLASAALSTEEALKDITLKDLRNDFVIRMLTEHGKEHAMRVTGIAMSTLYATFGSYVSHSDRNVNERRLSSPDETQLLLLLSREGSSAAGIALWLIWKSHLSLSEIITLTWEQIDFSAGTVSVNGRTVPLHSVAARLLQEAKASRPRDADPHVLLTPRSQRPFELERLSVVIRTALLQGGLGAVHMTALSHLDKQQEAEANVLQQLETRPFITRNNAAALLHLSDKSAYRILSSLSAQGKLIRIGARYYLPGTAVPPEEHYSAICAKLQAEGGATLGELTRLLGVENRACYWILSRFIAEGKLLRQGQVYKLPQE